MCRSCVVRSMQSFGGLDGVEFEVAEGGALFMKVGRIEFMNVLYYRA